MPSSRFIALRTPIALILFLLTAAAGITLDQATKVLAFDHLSNGVIWDADQPHALRKHNWDVIPGWLTFEVMANPGAVFGLGPGKRVLFIGVSIAAIFFIFYLFAVSDRQRLYQFILGMLLAGVIGNLYDRIVFRYVRDMIHMKTPHWDPFPYIYNVADSLLCVGVGLMVMHSFFHASGKETVAEA
jgi:signal peptidase II